MALPHFLKLEAYEIFRNYASHFSYIWLFCWFVTPLFVTLEVGIKLSVVVDIYGLVIWLHKVREAGMMSLCEIFTIFLTITKAIYVFMDLTSDYDSFIRVVLFDTLMLIPQRKIIQFFLTL